MPYFDETNSEPRTPEHQITRGNPENPPALHYHAAPAAAAAAGFEVPQLNLDSDEEVEAPGTPVAQMAPAPEFAPPGPGYVSEYYYNEAGQLAQHWVPKPPQEHQPELHHHAAAAAEAEVDMHLDAYYTDEDYSDIASTALMGSFYSSGSSFGY